MANFEGTIQKNDLAGGYWELQGADGTNYQLEGGDDALKQAGQKVRITGRINKDAMGIGMSGPHLVVESWEAI